MNNQVVHIAAEIFVLGGLVVYFNKQNNALKTKVEELSSVVEKLRDSNDKLTKHVSTLYNMFDKMSEMLDPVPVRPRREEPVQRPISGIRRRPQTIVKRHIDVNEGTDIDISLTPQQQQQTQQEAPQPVSNGADAFAALMGGLGPLEAFLPQAGFAPMMMTFTSTATGSVPNQEPEQEAKVEVMDEDIEEELALFKEPEEESQTN